VAVDRREKGVPMGRERRKKEIEGCVCIMKKLHD